MCSSPSRKPNSALAVPITELFHRVKSLRKNFSRPIPDQHIVVWSCSGGTGLEFKLQDNQARLRGKGSSWLISNRIHDNIENHYHARVVQRHTIDWELVKGWFRHCRATHSTTCGHRQSLAVPDIQVIDCSSRKIVQLPENLQFAALSYCWGRSQGPPVFELRLSIPMSPVVEDAMIVTRKLGLEYLWVDRHCIDQSDPTTKHTLIQRMDQIYHNAVITIIDAAGADPYYGLPGVSRTGRRPQDTVYKEGQKLVSIPNMREEISSSKWGRRGWTYQEGLLSRRRLVFTETQVYFQCLEQHFCESLSVPMGNVSRSYQRAAENLMQHTQAFPSQGVGTLPKHIFVRLREYHLRRLSHDSDILYAFTGILHHFIRRKPPTYHIWGVPFIRMISANGKDLVQDQFLIALLWLPGDDWKGTKLTRRTGFPSWSWTGWRGVVGIQAGHDVANTSSVVKNVGVSIVREGIEPLTVAQYVTQLLAEDYNIHRYSTSLHMTGWVTYVRLIQSLQLNRSNSDLSDRGSKSTIDIYDESVKHRLCQAHVMTHYVQGQPIPTPEDLYKRKWPVLLYFGLSGVLHGIILREVGQTVYEKLGVLPHLEVDLQPSSSPQGPEHCYLHKRSYGSSLQPLKLHCERKSIILR